MSLYDTVVVTKLHLWHIYWGFYVRFHWLNGLCLILFKDKPCLLNKLLSPCSPSWDMFPLCRFTVKLILCLALVILPTTWNTFEWPVLHFKLSLCWQLCGFTEVIFEPVILLCNYNSWRAGLGFICSSHPLHNALCVK